MTSHAAARISRKRDAASYSCAALPGFGRAFITSATHVLADARPIGAYQAALAGCGVAGGPAPLSVFAVKGQRGRTNPHRSTVPSRLRFSGGFLPVPTVETVPTASPSLAVGTTYSQTPALSCFHTGGSLGGASAPFFSSVR